MTIADVYLLPTNKSTHNKTSTILIYSILYSEAASVGSNDDNRSRLSLTSGFLTLEQRQKQENRKRRKQQNDKKKQQQKYIRDTSGLLLPNQDKHEKKHRQESYADKVKNSFVGIQQQLADDGGDT